MYRQGRPYVRYNDRLGELELHVPVTFRYPMQGILSGILAYPVRYQITYVNQHAPGHVGHYIRLQGPPRFYR